VVGMLNKSKLNEEMQQEVIELQATTYLNMSQAFF
jgi:hypothetical protein